MNSTEKTNLPYIHKNKFSQSHKVAQVDLTHKYFFPGKFPPSPLSRAPDKSSFSYLDVGQEFFITARGKLFSLVH